MNTPLNNDTQQKAHDLARQITVAHDLDPEIQEELYGHIEDKLLAYKSGEERVSDEDAFILVREHFGDAKVIRGLMQEVHAGAVQVTLLRKMLALVIVLLASAILYRGATELTKLLFAVLTGSGGILDQFSSMLYLQLPASFAVLLVTFFVLRHWKRGLRAGKSPWFCHWPVARMLTWAVALLVLKGLLPHILLTQQVTPRMPIFFEYGIYYAWTGLHSCAYCLLWFWWTDVWSGRFRNMLLIGLAWIGYTLGSYLLYPGGFMIAINAGDQMASNVSEIVSFAIGGVEFSVQFALAWSSFYFSHLSESIMERALWVLVCAALVHALRWYKKQSAHDSAISGL